MPLSRRMPQWKLDKAKAMRKCLTPAEARLLRVLQLNIDVRVRSQTPMLGYIADIYIPQARLVVEVDGPSHIGREQYDENRDKALRKNGIMTIRFTNAEVLDSIAIVIKTVKRAVRYRIDQRRSGPGTGSSGLAELLVSDSSGSAASAASS